MKVQILSTLFMGMAACAQAQHLQKYLQVNAGVYSADQKLQNIPSGHTDQYGSGPGYTAGVTAGIVKNRLKLEAGVTYLQNKSSYIADVIYVSGTQGELVAVIPVTLSERYRHLLVPVTVGYNVLAPGRKLQLYPMGGIAYSYNLSHQTRTDEINMNNNWQESSYLGKELRRSSLWGTAGVEAGYRVGSHWSVMLRPELWYMLTSFTSRDVSVKQHTFMAGVSAGLRYRFG